MALFFYFVFMLFLDVFDAHEGPQRLSPQTSVSTPKALGAAYNPPYVFAPISVRDGMDVQPQFFWGVSFIPYRENPPLLVKL